MGSKKTNNSEEKIIRDEMSLLPKGLKEKLAGQTGISVTYLYRYIRTGKQLSHELKVLLLKKYVAIKKEYEDEQIKKEKELTLALEKAALNTEEVD